MTSGARDQVTEKFHAIQSSGNVSVGGERETEGQGHQSIMIEPEAGSEKRICEASRDLELLKLEKGVSDLCVL